MTHRAKKARDALLHWRNFVAGTLIGTAMVTPVFAATDLARSDWTMLLLVGSIVLLSIGVLLRIRARDPVPKALPLPDPQDSIGHYRPHIYRP